MFLLLFALVFVWRFWWLDCYKDFVVLPCCDKRGETYLQVLWWFISTTRRHLSPSMKYQRASQQKYPGVEVFFLWWLICGELSSFALKVAKPKGCLTTAKLAGGYCLAGYNCMIPETPREKITGNVWLAAADANLQFVEQDFPASTPNWYQTSPLPRSTHLRYSQGLFAR